jgi:DNA-binding GntR family transcriptional regulator
MLTVEAIRERILEGKYGEGDHLRQDAIAAELGVSRIPVREALRQLEAEGLVVLSPHAGSVVSSLSLREIRELFEIRAVIEGDLLRRAIPRARPEDLARAAEILEEYEAALEVEDIAAWGALNWRFHSALYAPAGRPLTMGIVHGLHLNSDRYLRMQLALARGVPRAKEEHRAILRTVREGDAQHSVSLLSSHILGAGQTLLHFLRRRRAGEAEPGDGPSEDGA